MTQSSSDLTQGHSDLSFVTQGPSDLSLVTQGPYHLSFVTQGLSDFSMVTQGMFRTAAVRKVTGGSYRDGPVPPPGILRSSTGVPRP